METKLVLFLSVTIFVVVSGEKEPVSILRYSSAKNYLAPSDDNSTLRCGGVLTAKVEEVMPLMYKAFEPASPNERCVWTVRAPGAGSYNVEVLYLGYEEPNDDHRLIISGMVPWPTDGERYHVVNETNERNVPGTVLVITFQTGANVSNSRGFILSVRPRYDIYYSSDNSTDVITSSSVGVIQHTNYPLYDMSLYVFTPFNNTYEEGRKTDIIFTNNGLSGDTCADYVKVHTFNASSENPHKFDEIGRLCGDTQSAVLSITDVAIFAFRSGQFADPGQKGFQLTFTTCTA